jgi:thiamine biosynthesis lipoprotein
MKSLSPLLPLITLVLVGCDGSPRLFRETRFALGPVEVSMQVVATDPEDAARATDDAFAAVARVNNLLSSHLPESEISYLNQSDGETCHLSRETVAVLRRSLDVSRLTGGAFDVTAAPLIRLWKEAIETKQLPGKDELAETRKRVGYRKLHLGPNSARAEPGVRVDLGGIAKGYAVDQAVVELKARGIGGALVDAGGDGYAFGTRPDGTPWRVGIQHPRRPTGQRLPDVLLLSDRAYATSGDYRQYVEIDGVRYAHIIDPRTGRPARAAVSVTVVAPDCTTADALATAVSVLGPGHGVALIDRLPDVECMVMSQGPDGLQVRYSRGFESLAVRETAGP